MQAYEGYFENGLFYSAGRTICIPEKKRVFITILEEPATTSKDENAGAKAFFTALGSLPDDLPGEELRTEDFPRMSIGRDIAVFSNEESI